MADGGKLQGPGFFMFFRQLLEAQRRGAPLASRIGGRAEEFRAMYGETDPLLLAAALLLLEDD